MVKTNKDISLYREFIKKYSLESPDNSYLVRTALLSPSGEEQHVGIEAIRDAWTDFLKNDFHRSEIKFYNHIPYCHQRCSFCCYSSDPVGSPTDLKRYVDDLLNHYRAFSPTFKGIEFSSLYFGGGTPSILSVDQMKMIFSGLFSEFDFEDDAQRCIEFNPSTSSSDKLRLVRDLGFNKVSFGVQSFDPKVLKMNNRGYQAASSVERAVGEAIDLGIETVSIDLLSGLYGDTGDELVESFDRATDLGPDSIYIYSVQPTDNYLKDVCQMEETDFWEYKKNVLGNASKRVFEIAERKGYLAHDFTGDNPDMRDRDVARFVKKGRNHEGRLVPKKSAASSIFGMGTYSYSYIYKRMTYTMNEMISTDPEKYLFWTNRYDEGKDMLNFLYAGISHGSSISLSGFRNNFGRELEGVFGEAIDRLKSFGAIRFDGDRIRLNEEKGINWMMMFLFFVDKEEIKRAMEMPLPKIDLRSDKEKRS